MLLPLHYLGWSLGLSPAVTQTTEAERDCLVRHVRGRSTIVEIGVFEGVTSRRLRQVMAPTGTFFAIDPYRVGRLGVSFHEKIARGELGRERVGTVEWIRTTGAAAIHDPRLAARRVDFVFVDGDHSWAGIESDWNAWSGKVVPGGIMAFHDSRNTDNAGSQQFTEQVIVHDPRFRVIETQDRLTVIQRRDH